MIVLLYFKAFGGKHWIPVGLLYLLWIALEKVVTVTQSWYLGYWASQYEDHSTDTSDLK